VTPELVCRWRDESELDNHVTHGFYTVPLAEAVKAEGLAVMDAISKREHPCLDGWARWKPEPDWTVPSFPDGWDTTRLTFWDRRLWAYGNPA
jgi:hypothetical protein